MSLWCKAKFKNPPFKGLEVWVDNEHPTVQRVQNRATQRWADRVVVPIALISDNDRVQYMALSDLELTPEYSRFPKFMTMDELKEKAQYAVLLNEREGGK